MNRNEQKLGQEVESRSFGAVRVPQQRVSGQRQVAESAHVAQVVLEHIEVAAGAPYDVGAVPDVPVELLGLSLLKKVDKSRFACFHGHSTGFSVALRSFFPSISWIQLQFDGFGQLSTHFRRCIGLLHQVLGPLLPCAAGDAGEDLSG